MDHVNEHYNLHKLLPDYQSAYRNGYSCETVIIKLMNDILWAMENQNVTALMALDLSVAFDTVDYKILSSVLEHNFGLYGFADDHAVGNKSKPGEWNEETRCMCELEECAANLKVWMNKNRLKMNNDKTEFILLDQNHN